MRWMIPLRVLMAVCYGYWYMAAGKHLPWVRSVAVNLCGFAVNVGMDLRYRYLFAQRLQRSTAAKVAAWQQETSLAQKKNH